MLTVLRANPQFRKLWRAQVVSQLGDWLARVAVLALIGTLGGPRGATGIGLLFAMELAVRLLPATFWSPLAGPLADRLPRRLLMVAADLVRALFSLALLLVDRPGELPLLYGILIGQMSATVFFEAARSASVPNTVKRTELHAAYALSAATWSVMLALGAFVGALLIRVIGARGLFVLDSVTYVGSALLLLGLHLPPTPAHPDRFAWRDVLLMRDIRRGLAHVRGLGLAPALFAKSFWGGAGGFLVILSVAGIDRLGPALAGYGNGSTTEAAGFATGLLYGARGVGTGIGPLLFKRIWGSSRRALRRQVILGFLVGGSGYALFGLVDGIVASLFWIAIAHTGGSAIWVGSTTLWQQHVDDAFRGRAYACEFLTFTLAFTLGGALGGLTYDLSGSVSATAWIVATVVLLMGALWSLWSQDLPRGSEIVRTRTRTGGS